MPMNRPADILLVEDNEADVVLTREGFTRVKVDVRLHHVENGVECMRYLRREGAYLGAPTPDVILLDLNMPVMDGREVLTEIVKDERLRMIPVVILTTSDAEADVHAMYELRCSTYITKPVDFREFREVIENLVNYWFSMAVLPSRS